VYLKIKRRVPGEAAAVRYEKAMKKGDKWVCGQCGLVVTVDEACGCVDMCDIMCCGEPMKQK
jgi:hypothetical protein